MDWERRSQYKRPAIAPLHAARPENARVLYVIIGRDGPQAKELRPRLRSAHLDHLSALCREGTVRLAGPLTDGAGSLILVDAPSEEEARALCDRDPYVRGGVFASVEIHPFKQVLPPSEEPN
ncbi:MAG: hypothetical protein D6760_10260 [Deltaproteobacteria bacterium]|nr:MAG: hypothetical protein D6760_10260 [Deltaproteobacteria bacterium]